ncbi:hypothetical protein TELCIR_01110 [Teladorsagia circumcincta]|uniref:Tyrosinase copper-binding domain-containing protein n=1 Tax=Teladorsagia circumcincta TaxID=45464 RepID=A0A2G9V4B3_TELCI|nr:hypothetical protein TELCIR_01110 [Teladorsagia circumcincta]
MDSLLTTIVCLLSIASNSWSFITETRYQIGNKKYIERFEQPWFRVEHDRHHKVEEEDVDSSAFGKHYIPEDDIFVSPDWTPHEEKYLPCLDRRCVCPYFNGTIRKDDCVLSDGKILRKAHRQEIRTLDDEKRKQFELVIRHYLPDPNMGVPYWDSTLDAELPEPADSMIFTDTFLGESDDDGFVVTGPYTNWTTMEGRASILREIGQNEAGELLNNARVDWIVNNPDINMYSGGDMGKSHSSSNDVVFLYHHSMIDLIYEHWRQKMQTRCTNLLQDPPALELVRTADPSESYLFCHVPDKGEVQCMARIRLGGKCSGFEGTEICFVGECIGGVCKKKNHKPPSKLKKSSSDWYM